MPDECWCPICCAHHAAGMSNDELAKRVMEWWRKLPEATRVKMWIAGESWFRVLHPRDE